MKHKRDTRREVESPSAETKFEEIIEEAELCCEHARLAARQKRFEASRGLFITAAALYHRAVRAAGTCYPSIENRLREIELEMAAYSELARSMARPLLSQPPVARASNIGPAANTISVERTTPQVDGGDATRDIPKPVLHVVR